MNINYKQPQFELFPANSATLEDVNKPRFLLANLTLSIESLVIFAILGIMLALFSFSLGVERGKHLSAQVLDERVSAAWNLAARKPVVPAVAVKPLAPVARKQLGNNGFIGQTKVSAVLAVPAVANAPTVKQAVVVKKQVIAPKSVRFVIQAATNKNEAYARDEALRLKAKGLSSFLIKKGDFWLVCVGPFASSNNAAAALKKIQSKYPGSSVRRF